MLLLYDFFFCVIILLVGPMGTVLKALGKCGKRLENSTRKASGVTVNVWQHRKWDLYSLFYLEKKKYILLIVGMILNGRLDPMIHFLSKLFI